ncbi:ATP-binding protein [Nocardioides marinquilinus]|uniref:ATP-binding protein n=1 Tax=Nocardioides marinquilinus TaxID=1210400 RepID=A0ABP9Q1G3_9ACTN
MSSPEAGPDLVVGLAVAALERAVAAVSDSELAAAALEPAEVALAAARAALAEGLADDIGLADLVRQAGLSGAEAELLAVLIGTEIDERLQRLVVSLTDDRARHHVELWLLPHLLPGATPALAGPGSALVRAGLVRLSPRGAFGRTALVVPPRLLWALCGDTQPDPSLPAGLELVVADVLPSVPARLAGHDAVLVVGPDKVRRRRRALESLGASGVLATAPPTDALGWESLVLEATLADAAVLLETSRPLDDAGRRCVEQATHLRWGISSALPLGLDDLPHRPWREVTADEGTVTAGEWSAVTGQDGLPQGLTAEQLGRMSRALGLTGGDAIEAYRRLTDAGITDLATRVVPRAGWDDLVLDTGRKQRLRDLVDRYRSASVVYGEWGIRPSPSRGLIALFSGASGTGKTLSAEVVAGELGLAMYRLDLSAVVSKYIGETEKNLDALFDAASIGGTLLFFDEADAMFGKRTEVSDAHDRYANVGTSYLLQRLERYDGIVVLATNFEKNIDEAFVRRVHVRLDFQLPAEAERRRLWEYNLAAGMPLTDDIDLDWLVRSLDVSGASIRNIAVDAAFLAAREGTAVSMAHLVQGAAREMHKSSRMITRGMFGDWFAVATAAG